VNDRDSPPVRLYDDAVSRFILLLVLLVVLGGAVGPLDPGPLMVCPSGRPVGCERTSLLNERLHEPTLFVQHVRVDPEALPLSRPPMVWIVAMASSELRWNGVVVGRNGRPGPDRASEIPGRFVATFVVPARLVRPGDNLLELRLSANHLWLPVQRPFHYVDVTLYETPFLPGLFDYLPALIMLGAFLAALIYFGAAARSDRSARLLAIVAGAGIVQLVVEVSRAFIAYTYPWHLARVSAIAVFAAVGGIAIARYAARRFAPGWERAATLLVTIASVLSILLIPGFDLKALGAIAAGVAALLVCALRGLADRRPQAVWALVAALVFVAAMAWELTLFLDRGYYLVLGPLLVALIAEQVSSLRRARAERDLEMQRSAALAERLARAEREGEPIVALRDGNRTHRVAESDIVSARAADDYCDVALKDGRTLLVTIGLTRLIETLPPRFVRVHKSHVVNRAHVVAVASRPAGGRALTMSDGSSVPVGRSYDAAVKAWLEGPNPASAFGP